MVGHFTKMLKLAYSFHLCIHSRIHNWSNPGHSTPTDSLLTSLLQKSIYDCTPHRRSFTAKSLPKRTVKVNHSLIAFSYKLTSKADDIWVAVMINMPPHLTHTWRTNTVCGDKTCGHTSNRTVSVLQQQTPRLYHSNANQVWIKIRLSLPLKASWPHLAYPVHKSAAKTTIWWLLELYQNTLAVTHIGQNSLH